jgi:hypothetical protein
MGRLGPTAGRGRRELRLGSVVGRGTRSRWLRPRTRPAHGPARRNTPTFRVCRPGRIRDAGNALNPQGQTGSPHPSGSRPTPPRFRTLRFRFVSGSGLRARSRTCARRPPGLRASEAAVLDQTGRGRALRSVASRPSPAPTGGGVGVDVDQEREGRSLTPEIASARSPRPLSRPEASPDYRAGPFYP